MGRRLKQLLYGIFYIVFLTAVLGGIYFLFIRAAPSCFDGVENQGEQGVDCGGPCKAICASEAVKPINIVGQPFAFEPDGAHISLLAQISNPNISYAARSFAYVFSLYDNSGALIQSFSGASFIYASEVKYVLVAGAEAPKMGFSRVDFKIENPAWVSPADFNGPPQLIVSGIGADATGGALTVKGQITNKDTASFPGVVLIAIFRGALGQAAGASQTLINDLVPNESRQFSISHPAIANVDLPATKVFAYAARP